MDKVKVEKIIGWVLLFVGVGIIVYSVLNVVNVFNGKVQPYELFTFSSIGLDFSSLTGGQPIANEDALKQTLVEEDMLNKPFNIVAYVVMMGFISSAGLKIAQVGTMLIRSIKVTLLRKGDIEVKKE